MRMRLLASFLWGLVWLGFSFLATLQGFSGDTPIWLEYSVGFPYKASELVFGISVADYGAMRMIQIFIFPYLVAVGIIFFFLTLIRISKGSQKS